MIRVNEKDKTEEDLKWLDEQLLTLEHTRTLLLAGDADPITQGAALEKFSFRSKTVVFDEYADRSEVAEQARDIVDLRQVREIVASEVAKHGVERDADAEL